MSLELNLYSPLRNSANLVSYYRLEGNSNDEKGANNGTDTSISYSSVNGKFGQGAGFGGSSYIATTAGFNTALTSNNWTIQFWAKPTSATASSFFVANDNNTGTRQFAFGYGFDISGATTTTGKFYFEKGGTPILANTGSALTTGWQLITLTYDGTNIRTYINSSLNSTTAMTPLASSANSVYFGERQYSGAERRYTGALDDLSIFSNTLSGAEITNYYNFILSSGAFAFF